jgi:hypothetical protein
MLDGGNLEVQNMFYEYFYVNQNAEYFFMQVQ